MLRVLAAGAVVVAAPERVDVYIQSKHVQLEDQSIVDSYREIDDIAQWRPGDPRLPAVADRLVAQFEAVPEEEWKVFAEGQRHERRPRRPAR